MGYCRDVLIERASEAHDVRELFDAASPRLRRLVDFDAAVWLATDPTTGLPTAPTHVENLAHLGRANRSRATTTGRCRMMVEPRELEPIEILGPQIRFVTAPEGDERGPCVMHGTIPAHGSVPLHRHQDPETFYVLSGDFEVFDGNGWVRLRSGDLFHVPGNATHGFRNGSDEPAVTLITSTVRIGRFFHEVAGASPEQFAAIAERYGHAVGLE